MTIKTRFAPSPTGDLHLGSARTALFAWLYARHHGGQFVLRIEDTDRERSTQASVNVIIEAMQWLGLDADEGPYYQSERLPRYQEQLDKLLGEGKAYRCYCPKERLQALRDAQMARGEKPKYDGCCRPCEGKIKDGPYVVRFKQPTDGELSFDDLVRGPITVKNAELDDIILARSDGAPTYNFTVVIDDGDMGITHVLRGDDHINNTPRQIHICKALGYEVPIYGHLSSILGPDGKRLSKRHGAKSVLAYRDEGYLPKAMLNMLARLGWSHGDQELFTKDELIDLFDLDAVQKSAASFSPDKCDWLNQQHIMASSSDDLTPLLKGQLEQLGIDADDLSKGPDLESVAILQQSRCKTIAEMAEQSAWFYQSFPAYQDEIVQGAFTVDALPHLDALITSFERLTDWSSPPIHEAMKEVVSAAEVGFSKVGKPLRTAVTGGIPAGNLPDLLAVLGKSTVMDRIGKAIDWINAR